MIVYTAEGDLRRRAEEMVASIPWFHSIQLFEDLVSPGRKSVDVLALEKSLILDLLHLKGKSVIDVGAWNGFYSLESKRAGADRVIATDSFAWKHEIFRGKETFELARECAGLEIDIEEIGPMDFPGNLPAVDVVLFLGVLYHMYDPIAVLERVASRAKEVLVVETALGLVDLPGPAMMFFPRSELASDLSNWWAPNAECVFELLWTQGFGYVCFQHYPNDRRGIFHAFRTVRSASEYLKKFPDNQSLFDLQSEQGKAHIFAKKA